MRGLILHRQKVAEHAKTGCAAFPLAGEMGEENWPKNVVRTRGVIEADDLSHYWANFGGAFAYRLGETALQEIIHDGPRTVICADCGTPQTDGNVVHLKPAAYAIRYKGETFFLERHIGVACGCAAKRGLVSGP